MEDLKGVPYKKLSTAFLFRTKYDAQCKCQPHPWEEVSRDRHRLYALEAAKLKGVKVASKDIDALKGKLENAEKVARAEAAKQQEAQAAQIAHLAKLASAKKKAPTAVAKSEAKLEGKSEAKAPVVAAAATPSPLDPAFRAGKIKPGNQAAGLMGPPSPPSATPPAKVTTASATQAPRADALKGAVILRLGANPITTDVPRVQKPAMTMPPIINRRLPAGGGENWRKSAFQPGG